MATVLTRRFRSCKAHYATVAIKDDADITPRPPAKLYRLLVFDRPSPVVGCTLGGAAGACSQISIIPSFRRAHQLARGSAGEWDMGNDSSVDAYSAAEYGHHHSDRDIHLHDAVEARALMPGRAEMPLAFPPPWCRCIVPGRTMQPQETGASSET
ncbi:hypothetical protein Vi05172_g12734 [Venturia inaequalis]|nr:hypothetical protein Vi05172_g12734 [Venturia inaequalis]